jgi:hypothetical protein
LEEGVGAKNVLLEMKQTKEILRDLEARFRNIDYYQILVQKIEKNVNDHPDIAIEGCKALIEGMSKFIWRQIDLGYDTDVVDKMDFQPLFKTAMNRLSAQNSDLEVDFIEKANKLIVSIGLIRNKRGDISHGKLAPKQFVSDSHFSNLVISITDSVLSYILQCFANIKVVKQLAYDDNPTFNEKLDSENPIGFLSYSKALFDQDQVAYEQELQDYLDTLEIPNENESPI